MKTMIYFILLEHMSYYGKVILVLSIFVLIISICFTSIYYVKIVSSHGNFLTNIVHYFKS